jgi:hypothetical protein
MFTREFAPHGRLSVRTLRHYDAIGLLRPARVGPGHRRHEAARLATDVATEQVPARWIDAHGYRAVA